MPRNHAFPINGARQRLGRKSSMTTFTGQEEKMDDSLHSSLHSSMHSIQEEQPIEENIPTSPLSFRPRSYKRSDSILRRRGYAPKLDEGHRSKAKAALQAALAGPLPMKERNVSMTTLTGKDRFFDKTTARKNKNKNKAKRTKKKEESKSSPNLNFRPRPEKKSEIGVRRGNASKSGEKQGNTAKAVLAAASQEPVPKTARNISMTTFAGRDSFFDRGEEDEDEDEDGEDQCSTDAQNEVDTASSSWRLTTLFHGSRKPRRSSDILRRHPMMLWSNEDPLQKSSSPFRPQSRRNSDSNIGRGVSALQMWDKQRCIAKAASKDASNNMSKLLSDRSLSSRSLRDTTKSPGTPSTTSTASPSKAKRKFKYSPIPDFVPPPANFLDSSDYLATSSWVEDDDQSTAYEEHSDASEEDEIFRSKKATVKLSHQSSPRSSIYIPIPNPFSLKAPLPQKNSQQQRKASQTHQSLRALNQSYQWSLLRFETAQAAALAKKREQQLQNSSVARSKSTNSNGTTATTPLCDEDDYDDLDDHQSSPQNQPLEDESDVNEWLMDKKQIIKEALLLRSKEKEDEWNASPSQSDAVMKVGLEILITTAREDLKKQDAIVRIQSWTRCWLVRKQLREKASDHLIGLSIAPPTPKSSNRKKTTRSGRQSSSTAKNQTHTSIPPLWISTCTESSANTRTTTPVPMAPSCKILPLLEEAEAVLQRPL